MPTGHELLKTFKKKLRTGNVLIGPIMKTCDPAFVEVAGYAGFHFVVLDTDVIIQIEGDTGITFTDEILEVDGIDVVFIGPYDLSQSLGVPGQIHHSKVIEKMNHIVCKAKEKGIVVGTFVDEEEDLRKWRRIGVQYLSYSVDVEIFLKACKEVVDYVSDKLR